MGLIKNTSYNLLESDIRYAMSQTNSNAEAARYLRISTSAYRRYAEKYIDVESGKSLYKLHMNKPGKTVRKTREHYQGAISVFDIVAGKAPTYLSRKLKDRLIKEGLLKDECNVCGYDERRLTDNKVPLVLIWLDGDKTNHKYENLELVCHNCYFLGYGNYQDKSDALKHD